MNRFFPSFVLLLVLLLAAACGSTPEAPAEAPVDGLTQDELENGLGPVRTVALGPVDDALAALGQQSFETKCAACHKLDARYVGPPLGDVLARRSPAFVMNMMLNPDEMVKRHPEGQAMLAQFLTPMPNQNLSQDEARAILEYLRQASPTAARERESE